jgi:murein tripeptide amidase MpaA
MLFAFSQFALLIEIDEHGHVDRSLQSEESHLTVIRQWLSETRQLERMYVLRVNPDGKQPMFKKQLASNSEQVWVPTPAGEIKMRQVLKELTSTFAAGLDNDEEWIEATFNSSVTGVVVHYLFFDKP